MPIFSVEDPDDPRLAGYASVPEPELVRGAGLFVAVDSLNVGVAAAIALYELAARGI